ncbi:hypothetical protein BDB00DRAFT_836586 [Zychaea mexicana]|uniref:uncharacterized protein n=1 Tax=Zychaea mexicana TaxID=64656 RepID=UPI0022FEF1F2|nr:uncharacterized protein BDB00DRAFT_836586 [Zychaea mexicana]KAI9490749.1 hypothetical protein BDB00DRAFT_836586 [Zychaea mexicana]
MAPPPPNNVETKYYDLPTAAYRRGSITALNMPVTTSKGELSWKQSFGFTSGRGAGAPLFGRQDRKWRWWHYLTLLIFVFGALQLVALVTGYRILHGQPSAVRIALRQYPAIPYKHLDTSIPVNTQQGATVYHVTKEFGPAMMSSIGVTVTALAAAQQKTGNADVRIVMPYYSFLKNKYDINKYADMVIDVRDKKKRLIPIEFRVWKMDYVFDPPAPPSNVTVWQLVDGVNTSVSVAPPPEQPKPIPRTERVQVYLIGPGNRRPFSQVFRARNALQIYSNNPPGLPREWQDQFFSKAAAAFLTHQAAARDEESLFAPIGLAPHIDVVHLHGASTAYIAKALHDKRESNQLGPKPPAVVYTIHDYKEELQYTNSLANVHKFMDEPPTVDDLVLQPYTRGQRVFMSSLGMDHANVATMVGRTMASDLVEGRLEVYLKEIGMESVLKKAQERRFFGISNGVDFNQLNPFRDPRLVTRKLGYPEYSLDMIRRQPSLASKTSDDPKALDVPDVRTIWPLSDTMSDYVTTSKDRAKRFLVRRSLLNEDDLKRPLALYIGQFQHDKGLELFEDAAAYFVKHDVKFVIIGQPGDYPLERVEALQEKFPDHVIVMSTAAQQRRWSIFCRAAADFVFVPSLTENFGLMAAEGLWFGSSVISTGVGGMGEYLIDRPSEATWSEAEPARDIHIIRDKVTRVPTVTSSEYYNAYLFGASNTTTLEDAIREAAADFNRNNASKSLREEYVLRMLRSSYSLGWHRGQQDGPVHDYGRVYAIALADRRFNSLNSHEVFEEDALLRRLLRQRQQNFHQVDYYALSESF